jgi:hypothetical protein
MLVGERALVGGRVHGAAGQVLSRCRLLADRGN